MPAKKKIPVTANAKKPTRALLYKQVLQLSKKLKVPGDAYKGQFRKSTADFWLQERKRLRSANVQLLRQKKSKKKNPALFPDLLLNAHQTELSTLRNGSLKVKARVHTVPKRLQIPIASGNVKKLKDQNIDLKMVEGQWRIKIS